MPMGSTTVTRLLTHDGDFHADEVLATAVLSALWPDAVRLRTRDRTAVAAACADPQTVVYDIGGRYEPGMHNFDHHQTDGPLRSDGTPYSTFGLVWLTFGEKWLGVVGINPALVADTHADLDAGFVKAIDQIDNGVLSASGLGPVGTLTLPVLLADLVPHGHDPAEREEAAFETAVALTRGILERRARRSAGIAAARYEVEAAIVAQTDAPILELPRNLPFAGVLQGGIGSHVRFVIYPAQHEWVLRAVELPGAHRRLRHPLPATWAGLQHAALAQASGVPDAIFCHRNRFIAVAASHEGIREMARRALAVES